MIAKDSSNVSYRQRLASVCTGEGHFDKTRAAASESTMLAEVEIALNGPVLVEADEVIEEAMDRYFKGKRWHFIKRDIRDYTKDSNALKRLRVAVAILHSVQNRK